VGEDGELVFLDFGCVKDCDVRFTDGILDILDACWQNDDDRAAALYRELGFGGSDPDPGLFDPKVLRKYHEIALAPLITPGVFDFKAWQMRRDLQEFVFKHPVFFKWVPPASGLMTMRVMGGIKGLFHKIGAHVDVYTMAIDTARRAGRLTARPPA